MLASPEITSLIEELEALRWTGRKGYGARALVGACLVKSLYAIPEWTRVARLIAEHAALRDALGAAPSAWACYRFAAKLRQHKPLLLSCLDRQAAALREQLPEMGLDVCTDATDLPAYANGQRYVSKGGRERERFSDPDASWGHRSSVSTRKGGGFYGYKLHLVVCARTGLPLAWEVATARDHEFSKLEQLLDEAERRGFRPETCALDKGYDYNKTHRLCAERGIAAVTPLRMTSDFLQDPFQRPECGHGFWTFAGADFKRKATQWRCPTGECHPESRWLKLSRRHPLIPRHTKRWRSLYDGRAAVEREFGRLKNRYGLRPLRVRKLERVALHADLVMLARLSVALAQARAVSLAA